MPLNRSGQVDWKSGSVAGSCHYRRVETTALDHYACVLSGALADELQVLPDHLAKIRGTVEVFFAGTTSNAGVIGSISHHC